VLEGREELDGLATEAARDSEEDHGHAESRTCGGFVQREEGTEAVKAIIEWVKAHKAILGWLVSFIAAGLEGTGHHQAAVAVGFVGAALLGAGHVKSDSYYKP
jgi:hypothetical protein